MAAGRTGDCGAGALVSWTVLTCLTVVMFHPDFFRLTLQLPAHMEGANKAVLTALHQPFWDELANSKVVLIAGTQSDD